MRIKKVMANLDSVKRKIEMIVMSRERKLKTILPKATGKTARSISTIEIKNGFAIEGEDYVDTFEDGRPPTSNSGDGALRRNLIEWARIKGIKESLVYVIARKIHEDGNLMWRTGSDYHGGGNYLSQAFGSERDIEDEVEKNITDDLVVVAESLIEIRDRK